MQPSTIFDNLVTNVGKKHICAKVLNKIKIKEVILSHSSWMFPINYVNVIITSHCDDYDNNGNNITTYSKLLRHKDLNNPL